MTLDAKNSVCQPAATRVTVAVYATGDTADLPEFIHRTRSIHDHVMLIDDTLPGDLENCLDAPGVVFISDRRHPGKGYGILKAAREAHRMGQTHMVMLDPQSGHNPHDIQNFIAAIGQNNDAILVGHYAECTAQRSQPNGQQNAWANFWLRLQTGRILKNADCTFRTYPLDILLNLKVRSRGDLFDMEVLVRAAWAGVPFVDVSLAAPAETGSESRWAKKSGWIALRRLLLNFHLTMRSITPLPHPKIIDDVGHSGRKISVLHPLRAIKALLTENATPKDLAAAAALGVFIGALPLIALHSVSILFAAGYFRLNKLAALTASQLCMPPIVPALCIEAGYLMRHGKFLTEISLRTLGYQALERLWEWLLGALVVAPLAAFLVGGLVYFLAFLVQKGILMSRPGNNVNKKRA